MPLILASISKDNLAPQSKRPKEAPSRKRSKSPSKFMASSGIRIEFSLPLTAQENMDEDLRRLFALSQGDLPQLRFYAWKKPSLTYGYFVKPEEWLHLDRLLEEGWDIGRRP